jgi:biotin carboxyl carrier protein
MARKLFATVNDSPDEITLERRTPTAAWTLPDADADVAATGPSTFSVLLNGRSHRVLVLKRNAEDRVTRMRIGGKTYTVRLQDEQERMMRTLGLDKVVRKVSEIKAPMPGMVIDILVKPGDSVKQNAPILVLEAMKMENVIKAPADVVIAAVPAEKGKAVEKGQLLVSFA